MNTHIKEQADATAFPSDLETKDDTTLAPATVAAQLTEMKNLVVGLRETVDELDGKSDPEAEAKLKKINDRLDLFESKSAEAASKAEIEAQQKKLDDRFDRIETALKRSGFAGSTDKKFDVNAWLQAAVAGITAQGAQHLPEHQKTILDTVIAEQKALNVGTATDGGYYAPMVFVNELIRDLVAVSPVRTVANVRNIGGAGITLPRRHGRMKARRGHEQGTKSETENGYAGTISYTAEEMYAVFELTNQMREDSQFDMEGYMQQEALEQFEALEGYEFVHGDLAKGEIEGILTRESKRSDAVALGSAAGITAQGLINLKYQGIEQAYSDNCSFILNRTTLGKVRTLKNDTGDFIWVPGLKDGVANTIDGDPYHVFVDMPDIAANGFPVAYGNWKRTTTLVDRLGADLLRDPYTGATNGRIRIILRRRVGGQIEQEKAFALGKVANG